MFFLELRLVLFVVNRVWLFAGVSGADSDLKIEKVEDPDLFFLDPERFRILKFVDPATSDLKSIEEESRQNENSTFLSGITPSYPISQN